MVERVQEIFGTIDDDRILAFQNRGGSKKAEGAALPPSPPSALEEGKIDAASLKRHGEPLIWQRRLHGGAAVLRPGCSQSPGRVLLRRRRAKELLAALHFNRAACYWKIATIKNQQLRAQEQGSTVGANTKDKGDNDDETDAYMRHALKGQGGDGQAELKRCEVECRACLDLSALHHKAALPPRCSSSCIRQAARGEARS